MATCPDPAAPRQLKILMLHGYTQSGSLFHAKTRSLEKLLERAFPPSSSSTTSSKTAAAPKPITAYPGGIKLIYPTGPINLRPSDIPGYTPSGGSSSRKEEETDAWGWWRKSDDTGEYQGFEQAISTIATAIKEAGGIDAVIGFSQGAAFATFLTSLLDPDRLTSWTSYLSTHPSGPPYPTSFLDHSSGSGKVFHPPLKFGVSYSGFYAEGEWYEPFYVPKIRTSMLHVYGSLDTVVAEERSLKVAEACVGWGAGRENVVVHPGGHYVPITREMSAVLINYIRETVGNEGLGRAGKEEEEEEEEESVEDMDVPF